jgi:hypothetical protein
MTTTLPTTAKKLRGSWFRETRGGPAPPDKKQVPMDAMRKIALVAGGLYLITFIAGIPPTFILYSNVLSNPAYIVGSAADTAVLWGGFLEVINALACIGTAVALFSVVRRQNEGFALGFVTARMFEAAVIVVGVVSILAVVTLRQAGATGADAASLVTTGRALVAIRDWTFLLGPSLIPGVNALLLGYLMYRSRLVPRLIPTLGLIGGPLLISSAVGTMFGVNEAVSVWSGVALLPIFLWELFLGLWLTFKGFQRSAPLMVEAAAQAASPDGSVTTVPSRSSVAATAGVA